MTQKKFIRKVRDDDEFVININLNKICNQFVIFAENLEARKTPEFATLVSSL